MNVFGVFADDNALSEKSEIGWRNFCEKCYKFAFVVSLIILCDLWDHHWRIVV